MEVPTEVDRLIQQGRTTMAVKRLHELTGMSLHEAKLEVRARRSPSVRRRAGRGRAYSGPPFRPASYLAFVLGALLAAHSTYEIFMASRTGGWPATQGIIEESEARRGRTHDGAVTVELILRYSYEVGGRQYTGDRVGYGKVLTNEGARRAARHYRIGRRVEVYHDPDNPGFAVLEKGGSSGLYLLLGLALAFLGIGRWMRRKAQEADARRAGQAAAPAASPASA